ncbi:uncharacterized protein LOC124256813 [Haliotis rubra]|uniref:uncharacterized protein LOC124256813 n=1 Tax=Haliotis rubra TaxID=36100 RepID=UPI001EE57D16|nr:uncharacterized protein LOC124256813 [Haliotis rubra]XP_046546731.1 uncharacterized protein LOC124256813 [Haliotis rubra]XP_046546732.1 uncharacterized protein LOC124256813 [Haliotis rubra]
MDHQKRRLQAQIKDNLQKIGRRLNGRPMTVAFIGTIGVGKSSLINTIATAMGTGFWQQHAYTGGHGGQADPVTAVIRRYPQCCRPEEHRNQLFPTLMDVQGLPDHPDAIWREALSLLFYGHIPEEANLHDVVDYLQARDDIRRPRYIRGRDRLKVDRVVVVASAQEHLPKGLLESVVKIARPVSGRSRRGIPIFGIMTKTDLVDPDVDLDYLQREEKFKDILGLHGTPRFLRCINYCSAIDPDNNMIFTSYPYIDVPVLRLMTQICDPAIEVVHQQEPYPYRQLAREKTCWIVMAIVVIFLAFVFILR